MNMPLGANLLPWLQGKELARLQLMLDYFLLNSEIYRNNGSHPLLQRSVRKIVRAPVRWRVRKNLYFLPWELWLARSTERVAERRSLVTGQELPNQATNAC
jgi:hypothetical protein